MEALLTFMAEWWPHFTGGSGVTLAAILGGWKLHKWLSEWQKQQREELLESVKEIVRDTPRTERAQNGVAKDVKALKEKQNEHGRLIGNIREDVGEIKGWIKRDMKGDGQ